MATMYLSCDAPAVGGVYAFTITAYDAATTYIVTINAKTVSQIGTGGTTATTATALLAALLASVEPEFTELTWSVNASTITATANESPKVGKTHTIATSKTGGAGTIGAVSTTTSPDGISALTANNCRNISGLARSLPVATDGFVLTDSDVDLLWGLSALSAVSLASIAITARFTGEIGLPFKNEDGNLAYNEYRTRYLTVQGATNVTIGRGNGNGSSRLMLDLSAVQTAVNVYKTASSGDDFHALILKGTHANNTLIVRGDSTVDVAALNWELATFETITVVGSAIVRLGQSVTNTTLNVGQNAIVESLTNLGTPTINLYDNAQVTLLGTSAPATVNVFGKGATLFHHSTGTIAALNLYDGATLDCDNNPGTGFTVTTLNGFGKPVIKDKNSRMTVTNPIGVNGGVFAEWKWNLKQGRALTLGAP